MSLLRPPRPTTRSSLKLPSPIIGLTGGMGAGKSTALTVLSRLGAVTRSSDDIVHELYERDRDIQAALAEHFGADLIGPDGQVDRGLLAQRAFSSTANREWLEQLIWPPVIAETGRWIRERERDEPPARAVVVEIPLLFESDMAEEFDVTIAVIAGEDLRGQRAAERGQHAINERAARQLSQAEKAERATFVVRNDGSLTELEDRLSDVLAEIEESDLRQER